MAERPTEFSYHNIQLYKSESLGSGSYGGVCKAKCDGLLCAAKIMHPTLFDLHDPGTASYLRKFQEECHLLSLAKHPNVVQYLGTYTDPDTRLPVLLMELCNESLTAFLERSPGPLSYHIQVNICHDIALALVYLHSNGLIHRDLTGNNVLMIAGPRAKITDFGMSKLASVNRGMIALTLCPGNKLYMSPEALDEAKSYTAKLDIFSFGVIVIQTLTRQFPNPTDRFHIVRNQAKKEDEELSEVRILVPETERRKAHLQVIPDTHTLKPLVLQCMKRETLRPSALQLSKGLFDIQKSSQYRESKQAERGSAMQLQMQLQTKIVEAKEHQARIAVLESVIDNKDTQLQVHSRLQEKDRQLQEQHPEFDRHLEQQQHAIASRDLALEREERELQQTREQLRGSEQIASEHQRSLQEKDKSVTELQRTILLSEHERNIQPLEQGDTPPQKEPVDTMQTAAAATCQKDIRNMRWEQAKLNAPLPMFRGAAVVIGNTAYIRPHLSESVRTYENINGKERWSHIPSNPYSTFGLVAVDGLLTSVGGFKNSCCTNTLLSLKEQGGKKLWFEVFPAMPTPRHSAACITANKVLVAAGGSLSLSRQAYDYTDIVEVMDTDIKQWTRVSCLPGKYTALSAAIFGGRLYLGGGNKIDSNVKSGEKLVFACSVHDLAPSKPLELSTPNIWKSTSSLPVTGSTLVAFCGHLLAIGGRADSKPTSDVYEYDLCTNTWTPTTKKMNNNRSWCFAVTLPQDLLVVVGGVKEGTVNDNGVEYFKF